MKAESINSLKWLSENPNGSIRVPLNDWQEILLTNTGIQINSKKRYLQGVHIGSNVFRLKLLPLEWSDEYGVIEINPGTAWITKGTGLVLKKNKCECS